MKKLILFALITTSLFLVGCTQQKPTENQNVNQGMTNIYQCEANDDCVLVSVGSCCSFTSVNKIYRDEIKFVPMVCAQFCEQKAICENNVCKVKK